MRLQLTRRADYAIRATICLARATRDQPMPAAEIARTMGVPARFLPQIMSDLGRAGLVEASLGRGGGYRLARQPERISLLEVIEAVEGDARRRTCVLSAGACQRDQPCDVHELFAGAQDALLERLSGSTVRDAIRQRRLKGRALGPVPARSAGT